MDPIAIGKALSDLGGWAAFLALVVLIAVTGYRRGWVYGWIFERSEKARETSDTQAERNAQSLESMAQSFAVMAKSLDRMESSVERIEHRLDRLASGAVKND